MENLWTHTEVATALSQEPTATAWSASGISIDSRTLVSGDIFVALRGETFDGHDYVLQAIERGAAAVIVDRPIALVEENYPQIIVTDTLKALWALGAYRRSQSEAKIVALTGSVGKTTTKEFLRQVCEKFGTTACAQSSYNNQWGVPLSLALMSRTADYGIFEIGMNHPGEIEPLARLVQPHVALITRIGEAHIGYLGSAEAIAKEKAEIFSGLVTHGTAVLNADDEFFELLATIARKKGAERVISFGHSGGADVRLLNAIAHPATLATEAVFSFGGNTYTFQVPFLGNYRVINILGVIAVLKALGIEPRKVIPHLASLALIKGRGQIHRLLVDGKPFTLIDDAYNANPTSVQAGLEVLAAIPVKTPGRRLVIFGEMGELGDYCELRHRALAPLVQKAKIDKVYACGPFMHYFYEDLPAVLQGAYEDNVDALMPHVGSLAQPGDVILVKGSKYTKVSRVVELFLNTYPRA